jgi:hypothetical protein
MTDAQRMWTLVAVAVVAVFLFWLVSALWRALRQARQGRVARAKADAVQDRIWAVQRREVDLFKNQHHKRDPWLQRIGYFWRRR